jgi:hypothetical protein
MKGTDTIHAEKILLQQVEDELSYNTAIKVKMTMNQYPLLTDRNETQLVLNEKHNYPQKSATRRFQRQSGD